MEHGPLREANSRSACQEFSPLYWKFKFNYRGHKTLYWTQSSKEWIQPTSTCPPYDLSCFTEEKFARRFSIGYSHIFIITVRSTVRREKLIVAQLVKSFPHLIGTSNLTTVVTRLSTEISPQKNGSSPHPHVLLMIFRVSEKKNLPDVLVSDIHIFFINNCMEQVRREKLIVAQLVKSFPHFIGNLNLITVVTRPSLNSVPKGMDPAHILMSSSCNNNFDIFLPSMSRSPKLPILEIHFYKIHNQRLLYTT